ncbi:MAG: signal peptidase II [Clostridia bacterium]|nr:signal peptidase II [Clostridia bacterium]
MSKRLLALIVIVMSVICDYYTKLSAVTKLKDTGLGSFDIFPDILSFTYHENRGAAFGMLSESRWVFMLVSSIAIIALGVYLFVFNSKSTLGAISLGLIMGGGIGNMIDRIKLGYVVDFIYFEPIDFPIFNFADICVTIGAALLILQVIFFDKKEGDLQGTT